MDTQTIYLIVGNRIREARARIVGKIAEVHTDYGIREFGTFFLNREEAEKKLNRRVK